MKKNSVDIDVEEGSAKPADLEQITKYTNEMRAIEGSVTALTEKINQLWDRYNEIEQRLLPDCMTQAGMSKFTLTTGEAISIKDFVRCSIPSKTSIEKAEGPEQAALIERRSAALAWLRKMKADSLIKNELVASFGKGEDSLAKKFYKQLVKEGHTVRLEESVHNSTLTSFLKDKIEHGVEVPSEPFALFVGKKAVITKPKQK